MNLDLLIASVDVMTNLFEAHRSQVYADFELRYVQMVHCVAF